jgi:hypothetical protein
VKFIIMQFSPRSVFLPFRSKYLPQHSALKNPPSTFPPPPPHSEIPSFAPIQHNWQNHIYIEWSVVSKWYTLSTFGRNFYVSFLRTGNDRTFPHIYSAVQEAPSASMKPEGSSPC